MRGNRKTAPASVPKFEESRKSSQKKALKQNLPLRLLWVAINSLLWGQLFLPPESVYQGDLIFLHSLWFLVLLVTGMFLWKQSGQETFSFDGIDLCLALICFSPLIPFFGLLLEGGELRSAFFALMGWQASAITVFLMRRLVPLFSLRLPVLMLLAGGLISSGYGIYQSHFFYPSVEAEVLPLVEEYRKLEQEEDEAGASSFGQRRLLNRLSELERQMSRMGIPLDKHARTMFLQRLRDSREPFGFFALANTLGGFLAAAMVLLAGLLFSKKPSGFEPSRWAILLMSGLLIGYCLLLTKSRTAWVGALVGLAVVIVSQVFFTRMSRKRALTVIGTVCLVLVFVIGLAILTGSLDAEVVTEAGKSFSYRLDYWTSTWEMLQQRILTGVGPGNFRQHYLVEKQARSSEEILDPHNLWLEAWSTGGILAVAGLAGLLLIVARFVMREQDVPTGETTAAVSTNRILQVTITAVLLSGVFVPPEAGRYLEMTVLWMILFPAVSVLLKWSLERVEIRSRLLLPPALVLWVHLLAAGGYGMPFILQLLLLLTVLPIPLRPRVSCSRKTAALICLASGAVLLIGSLNWGVLPRLAESTAMAELPRARSEAHQERILETWAEKDPWNPQPRIQQATLRANSGPGGLSNEQYEAAKAAWKQAIARAPAQYQQYEQLAALIFRQAQAKQSREAMEQAIEILEKAIERYPTKPDLRVQLAKYAMSAGNSEKATSAAKKALRLDDINRQYGHTDRYLTNDQMEEMRELADAGEDSPTNS